MRKNYPGYHALLGLVVATCLAACSSSGGNVTPPPNTNDDRDMGMDSDDGSVDKQDLSGRDLEGWDGSGGGSHDMTMTTGLPCSPGSYRCGAANAVEICNSTGSAWLYSATCAVSCSAGLCTGACTPGVRRCNVKNVEECNTAGTTWNKVDSCSGSCSSGKCALVSLDITMNQNLDGEVVVDGDVIVHSGVTLTSPTGNLTIRAQNITVENMATITVAASGNPSGQGQGGQQGSYTNYGGGGGGNGTSGGSTTGAGGGATIGVDTDMDVQAGGNGGSAYSAAYGGIGGYGGGVLRLFASNDITIAGFLTANGTSGTSNNPSYTYGGGGGGAGGGILLAASGDINMSGNISAAGGGGGSGYYSYGGGGAGGQGRVKILSGGMGNVTGSISAHLTNGLLPPVSIVSSSHPDSTLIYNDGFDTVDIAWSSPFAARQGYYHLINTNYSQVPTPATGKFLNTESVSYPNTAVTAGNNYFHITSVDAMSMVGTVEGRFLVQINSTPVSITSSSHSSNTTWYPNPNVFFSWALPLADKNQQGVFYEFDNYGDTLPTKASTFVPLPQKTLILSSVTNGIWVLHMLAMDQRGYLTRTGQHFRVNVGTDPGNGGVLGLVTDSMGKPISGAVVSVNRGLWSQTTNSSGNFNMATVSAGTYELRVTVTGKTPVTQMINVMTGMSTTANVSLP